MAFLKYKGVEVLPLWLVLFLNGLLIIINIQSFFPRIK